MTDDLPEVVMLDAPAPVVERFLYALQDKDMAVAEAVVDDRIAYQNVGFPTLHGRRRVLRVLNGLAGSKIGFEVKIHRIAAEGGAVLTERTDALTFGPLRIQFWVCGVFEVHEGRITLWRDYFDQFDFLKGTIRGLLAIVVPPLRQTL